LRHMRVQQICRVFSNPVTIEILVHKLHAYKLSSVNAYHPTADDVYLVETTPRQNITQTEVLVSCVLMT
jgi:hypothetical protein